jgi:hypothetical protein
VCIHIVGVALSVRCHVQTNCSKFKFTITNTMRTFNQCVKGGATIPLLLAHHCNHPAVARTANIVHIRAADYRHSRISFDQHTSGVARTCSHLVAPHRLGSTREFQSSLPTQWTAICAAFPSLLGRCRAFARLWTRPHPFQDLPVCSAHLGRACSTPGR